MLATVEIHANRNLRPRVLSDGSRRGTDRYFSFGHEAHPSWWNMSEPPVSGTVVGVYENHTGSPDRAIVICEDGLSILHASEVTSIRFDDIDELVPPRKDPVPLGLCLRLRSVGEVAITVLPVGAVFDFYRFLLSVARKSR